MRLKVLPVLSCPRIRDQSLSRKENLSSLLTKGIHIEFVVFFQGSNPIMVFLDATAFVFRFVFLKFLSYGILAGRMLFDYDFNVQVA
jgi:hypothetical protein